MTMRAKLDLPKRRLKVAIAALIGASLVTASLLLVREYQLVHREALVLDGMIGGRCSRREIFPEFVYRFAPDAIAWRLRNLEGWPFDLGFGGQGQSLTDRDIAPLADLTRLTSVQLISTNVSDEGMSALRNATRLVRLDLDDSRLIGDAGLQMLPRLPLLEILDLSRTHVSNRGIESLGPLPRLRQLRLDHTRVDDDVVEMLARCPSLEQLSLCGERLRGRTLGQLAKSNRLRVLTIAGMDLDSCAEEIVKLRSLEELNTECSHVTYDCLKRLNGLPNLRIVRFCTNQEGGISRSEAATLAAEFPDKTFAY